MGGGDELPGDGTGGASSCMMQEGEGDHVSPILQKASCARNVDTTDFSSFRIANLQKVQNKRKSHTSMVQADISTFYPMLPFPSQLCLDKKYITGYGSHLFYF